MSICIKHADIFYDGALVRKDILIEDGKITHIGNDLTGTEIIDATGLVVLPGAIDCHVHARDFMQAYKEDFLTCSMAAAAGGVTSFLAMPNTNPPVISVEVLEQAKQLALKSLVNWGCYFGASADVDAIKHARNIPGMKIYLDVTTGHLKVAGDRLLDALFASTKRIAVHAEGMHVQESIERIKKTPNMLYLCHISTKEEIEMIRKGKNEQVFCEVTPHHLFLTAIDEARLGPYGKMKPSLKTQEDVDALWEGIHEGIVDTIGTDHAPHTIMEKSSENPPWGVPGLETMLPLLLHCVHTQKLTLHAIVKLTAENPARIFGLHTKGKIEVGYDADLIIVDMRLKKKVDNTKLFTKCGWSPFKGIELQGWPVMTLVRGSVVFDHGKIYKDRVSSTELVFEDIQ